MWAALRGTLIVILLSWVLGRLVFDAAVRGARSLELTRAIATAAAEGTASADALSRARDYQRQAQFLADFIEAENSMGFHAPQEAMRVLGHSLNYARLGMTAVLGGS